MRLYRIVIGVQLNRKMFRISSLSGQAADALIAANLRKDGSPVFSLISQSNDGGLSLSDGENKGRELVITKDQFVVKRSAENETSSVSFDDVLSFFEPQWKVANEILSFNEIRRIGIVAEFRFEPKVSAGRDMVSSLLKLPSKGECGHFKLQFDEQNKISQDSRPIDQKKDDYENIIRNFYLSEMDETPVDGLITATVDYQRYFNPAKRDGIKEVKALKSRFVEVKSEFKDSVIKIFGL